MTGIDTIIGPAKRMKEEPTGELRVLMKFIGAPETLQQRWKVMTFENGKLSGVSIEWRDVPKIVGE